MKSLKYILTMLTVGVGQLFAQINVAGFNSALRPQTHLEKAEVNGWKEDASKRDLHYSEYLTQDGRKIGFTSEEVVNYRDKSGAFVPLDIRFIPTKDGWVSSKRPVPVKVFSNGKMHFTVSEGNSFTYGELIAVNGNSSFDFSKSNLSKGTNFVFENILPGIDRHIDANGKGLKSSLVLNVAKVYSSDFVFKERITVPSGYELVYDETNGTMQEGFWKGNLKIRNTLTGEELGRVFPVICYDAKNAVIEGKVRVVSSGKGIFTVETIVDKDWLNATDRTYPIVIDPLVTGPTTTWTGSYINSCFFPSYNADSINVTVPAGISVTELYITASFYASPFTTTVMGDGRMYFSTDCGQSTVFSVTGTTAASPGTAYLDNFDIHSPLMCCYPQNCSSFNFWLSFHLSRTSNGPLCSSTYLYYDPFGTSWPFSAYVEGYTAETYGPGMLFTPTSVCANTCSIGAKVYARYGVPPYTFMHPWSSDTLVAGTPNGCFTGNTIQTLTLDIPGCPNYCDTSTSMTVPAPIVIDACGDTLDLFDPSYSFTVKPVATASFSTDTIKICSGQSISASLTPCLTGASVNWTGNGISGGSTLNDVLYNTSDSVSYTYYVATVSTSGGTCTGIGDTLIVQTNPYMVDSFSVSSEPLIINQPADFTNLSDLNGNTLIGYTWTFGDSTFSLLENPSHTYSDTGYYTVCLVSTSLLGCDDTICRQVHVIDIELVLPNVMTPNSDGKNDFLYIKALEHYPENKIAVYNRWGQIVFEKENYKNDWDASGVSDGAYYYFLTVPNLPQMRSLLHVVRK